jgi:hypothetical protein
MRVEVASDWDLPLRPLGAAVPLEYRAVAEADLLRLRAEEAPEALPANAVRAVVEMLDAALNPTDPTSVDDFAPFVAEVREFLLAEGAVTAVMRLIAALKEAAAVDAARIGPLLAPLCDHRALGRLLATIPEEETTVPPDVVALFDALPGEPLTPLIDLLAEAKTGGARRHLRILIERYAAANPEPFFARMHTSPPEVVRDLLRACTRALPDRSVQAAIDMASHANDDVAVEGLRILSAAPTSPAVGRALVRMLESPSQEVRLRVAEVLGGRKEHAAFAPLVRFVERRAHHSLSLREAESYGQGLARLSPPAALSLFKAWAQPPSLMDRLMAKPHERLLRWAAVSGLAELPGAEATALIRGVEEKADDELRDHCRRMLARRARDEDQQWMS